MTYESTATVQADAKNRSARTIAQGLLLDVAGAVALVLAVAFTDIEWTPMYWKALGLLVAKTILQAVVAYWMRLRVPPAPAVTGSTAL